MKTFIAIILLALVIVLFAVASNQGISEIAPLDFPYDKTRLTI